jgi:hypothetical protein
LRKVAQTVNPERFDPLVMRARGKESQKGGDEA